MLVFGKNVLKELDPKKVRKAYLNKNLKDNSIQKYLLDNHIRFELVDNYRLDKLVTGNHQGIVIDIDDYNYYSLNDIDNESFIVMLDHLEDPHNLGAIIRTCECAGIKSIILPKDRSVRVNETVMKVSTGALERVKIILVNNMVTAMDKLKDKGYFIYAADMDGADYRTIDYAEKKVLVIGNEGKGISRLVSENSDVIISIPMKGELNSLNASVSAGILIYGMDKGDNIGL